MKTSDMRLLDEMIIFIKKGEKLVLLKKAYDYLDKEDVRSCIQTLLNWQFHVKTGTIDKDKYPIGPKTFSRLNTLFEACPVLLNLFALENENLIWAEKLSTSEVDEFVDYILNKHSMPRRVLKRPLNR